MAQLLLLLLILVSIIFGVLTQNIIWVLIASTAMALLGTGVMRARLNHHTEVVQIILQRLIGKQWQLLLYFALVLSAISGFLVYQDVLSRIAVWFWLLAIVTILFAVWLYERPTPRRWLAQSWRAPLTGLGWSRLDWALLILLTVVAFSLRIYQLDATFPPAREDEGFQGLFTLQARYGAQPDSGYDPIPFFGAGWFGHPALFYYLQAAAMQLFGESLLGLRILAVLVGTACAPTMYVMGKIGWGRVVGFSAAWLLAVSHFHIQYSRMALQNIETVWLMIVLGCCLLMIDQTRQRAAAPQHDLSADTKGEAANGQITWFVLSGLALALNQYFYVGARFGIILTAPLWLFWILRRGIRKGQLAVMVLVVIIVLLPQLVYYTQQPEHLSVRTTGVSIFTEENVRRIVGPDATLRTAWPTLLLTQFRNHWHFWFDRGDISPFYWGGQPAFDPITLILFWLGLGIVVSRCYRFPELLMGIWWGAGALTAGILTLEPAWGARLIVIAPAVYLIGGLFVNELFKILKAVWPPQTWRTNTLLMSGLIMVITAYLNISAYFVRYAAERPSLDLITVAEPMAAHADGYTSYLLGSSTDVAQGVIRFVARKAEIYNMPPLEQLDELIASQSPDKGLLFVAQPPRAADLALIEARLPGGRRQLYQDPKGQPSLITYLIPAQNPPAEVEQPQSSQTTPVFPAPRSPLDPLRP